jgi:hypothetical protein
MRARSPRPWPAPLAVLLAVGAAPAAGCWRDAPPPAAPAAATRSPLRLAPRPATGDAQIIALGAATVAAGAALDIQFREALVPAPGERYWVTVVTPDTPDDQWAEWAYVTDGARDAVLAAPAQAGRYEVRLHGNYPTQTTNVLDRVAVDVR